jgi:hypothetical protein
MAMLESSCLGFPEIGRIFSQRSHGIPVGEKACREGLRLKMMGGFRKARCVDRPTIKWRHLLGLAAYNFARMSGLSFRMA